jgi:Ribbon-helix-helix protein, copG family
MMATKSAPFSMRLSERMKTLVDREAQRTGRSRGAIVEALAEEALRTRLFPGIAFRGSDWDRRAWVIGTALDVWQIVDAHRDIGSVERMVESGAANERQIRLALDYYELFGDEIDAAIAENRLTIERLEEEFPFIAVSHTQA